MGAVFFLSTFIFGLHGQFWWYLAGGVIIYVLGALDDHKPIRWQVKLVVQLIIASIIIYRFVGGIESVAFFSSNLNFSTLGLIAVFLIWFVGILNSVNLIDGMDGLAGGFMVLTTFFAVIIGILTEAGTFVLINTILLGTLMGFLLFNQKPAKFFMGDSSSLLLGYHMACLPLLFHQASDGGSVLSITPFLILASFLIMDTTRVFFSRLLKKQNAMTADAIHLHHLMFQETNSYMGTLIPIFVLTWITGIGAVLYFHYDGFGYLAMQLFLLVLIIFVLTPPVPFYVPIASRLTRVLARLKTSRFNNKHLFRVRYLPVLVLIYMIIIGIQATKSIPFGAFPVELLTGMGLLLIFAISRPKQDESIQAGIILIVIVQILFFIEGDPLSYTTVLSIVRLAILTWMMIVAAANYVKNSRHLGFEFWLVLDLLVFLLYTSLMILRLNGLFISIFEWSEVVLMYYCLGLYGQHRCPRFPRRSLGAFAAK